MSKQLQIRISPEVNEWLQSRRHTEQSLNGVLLEIKMELEQYQMQRNKSNSNLKQFKGVSK